MLRVVSGNALPKRVLKSHIWIGRRAVFEAVDMEWEKAAAILIVREPSPKLWRLLVVECGG